MIGATVFVSCAKDDKSSKEYTADEQKTKLDKVATAFVNEFDLDNWKDVVEVMLPAVQALQSTDISALAGVEPEVRTETIDVAAKLYIVDYLTDYSNVKGHYNITDGVVVAESGTFDDFHLAFSAEKHDYDAAVKVVNSKNEIVVYEYEYEDDGYWDEEEDNWVEVSGMIHKGTTKVILPSKITATVTADKTTTFDVIFNMSYSGPDKIDGDIPDLSKIKANVSTTIAAGDYTIDLSKLDISDNNVGETCTLSHGKKQMLKIDGNLKNFVVKEEADYESGVTCDNAEVTIDIMGEIQIKGFVKYNSMMDAIRLASKGMSEETTAEDMNKMLETLKAFYSLDVYYDGGSSKQAWLELEADKYLEVVPVIVFQDGTRYAGDAIEENFSEKTFAGTIAAVNALQTKVESYFNALYGN